jgi:DNA-binding NarL/FixJ family response regulator
MNNPTKVLLVNEAKLVCNMLASLLEDEDDFEVVGSATSVEEVLNGEWKYDLLLVSTNLPNEGALRLTEKVTSDEENTRIVVLGLAAAKYQVLKFIEAGADGYVLKNHSVEELIRRIRAVKNDKAVVSPMIAGALIDRLSELAQLFSEVEAILDQPADLTPREGEILELIGEGLTNQEIADHLHIQLGTVKNHVHNILKKLDVSNRQKAAAYLAFLNEEE